MKPGRNDPCPCGSGRKYKHCCLTTSEAVAPDELAWRRVRRAIEPLGSELMREAAHRFGEAGLDEGWHEFRCGENAQPFAAESPFEALFFSWFLHHWLPDPQSTAIAPSARGVTAAQTYLARVRQRLDPLARRYVEACCATPFSFHEVIDCQPGRGLRLRDVLLGTEIDVIEKTGSRSLQAGDIVFAKVVPIEGIALIEGMGPVAAEPSHKPMLIQLRKKLGTQQGLFGADGLREFAAELRALYLRLAEQRLQAGLPELRNTDGDPLLFHTLLFDLDAPEQALERLTALAAGVTEPQVERDADGKLVRAELAWAKRGNRMHKEWDNTTLGHIRIEGQRLTAEVNSVRRAAALRKLIERHLGASAHVKPSIVQSPQSMLEREPTPFEQAQQQQRDREQAEFSARPEVQQLLREHLRNHYRQWVETKLPALGNRTPRQAVRDSDGREAVEALIRQIERDSGKAGTPPDGDMTSELRRTLGLSRVD